jgi:hypothetical protein
MRPGYKIVFALLVGSLLLVSCSAGQPKISVDPTEFDFGAVNIGEIVTQDLVVSNVGKADLVIDSVTTSCGCTSAKIANTRIPAGQYTTLTITFDGGAHGDVTNFYTRQVFVASNDPEQPEIRIEFTADVIRGSN